MILFTGALVSLILTDAIGQLHGYADGELFTTLNSEGISKYTVENEGVEIKTSDGNCQVKIDISKKIPLMDFSNVYIEVADLQNLETFISGDGTAFKNKGNVWFHKSGNNGENTLLVAEKGNMTENTYKSILSIIEVMFGSNDASNYFKSNYSSISMGNKEFRGFKIEVEPTKTEWEADLIPTDGKFVRITINKSEASKAFTNSNDTNGTDNNENKIANIAVIPKAGREQNIFLIALYIIIIATVSGIVAFIVKRKKV